MLACLAATLSAGVAVAPAQDAAPLTLVPDPTGPGATMLANLAESALSSNGQPASAITFALPRGTRVDSTSRRVLCGRDDAASAACPPESRIGFGRYIVTVRGHVSGGGETPVAWSIEAFLAKPLRRGDAAAVVLTSKLLGAESVASLLAPKIGTTVPVTVTTTGRLVRRSSGVEVQLTELPARLDVTAPITATPTRLELALSAVRRTRKDFTRRIRVRTLSGYEIRKVNDHRLIGHHLFRAPASCGGSWLGELRVTFPDGVKRTPSRSACTKS